MWSNLGEASGVRGLRTLAAWAIFFVMCAFYFIPVSESLCCVCAAAGLVLHL